MDQAVARRKQRNFTQLQAPFGERCLDVLAPRGLAQAHCHRGHLTLGFHGKPAARLGTRQGHVGGTHQFGHRSGTRYLDRAEYHVDIQTERGQGSAQRSGNGLRGLFRHPTHGQAQRKVGSIEPANQAGAAALRVGLQDLRDGDEHLVGAGVTQCAVHFRQVDHAQQDEAPVNCAVFALHGHG